MIEAIFDNLLWILISSLAVIVLGRLFITLPAWRVRRKKAIKESGFLYFLSGYYMFRSDENPNMFIISDGEWGMNETHLIFTHRSTLAPLDKTIEISKVRSLEVFDYDISERIFQENEDADVLVHGIYNDPESELPTLGLTGKIEDTLVNAAKKPMAKSVLAMGKKEEVCRITCIDGAESFFYYKNTYKNTENIEKIRRHVIRAR